MLDAILARYSTESAARPVAIHLCEWGEQPQLLRQGDADAALVHEPFDHTGLDAETVAVEPRIVALPAAHPLATRHDLRLADLDIPTGELRRYLDQATAGRGVRGLAQVLTLVELGELIQLLPESIAARYPRSGIAYRAVPDAPPAILAIAWPQQSRSQATAALVRAATADRSASARRPDPGVITDSMHGRPHPAGLAPNR